MRVIDIVNSPWAIIPAKLDEIQGIYATHLRGEKIDIAAIEARTGQKLQSERKPYQVVDGVAILGLDGVLAKKMNLFMQFSGGTSMQILGDELKQAASDADVKQIILCVDSPGGTVDGTQELARLVAQVNAFKPVVSLCNGTMCSAAYWVGSAAGEVLMTSDTDMIGSIGVVATHLDVSGLEAQRGVKTTEITAGKYKRIASQYGPLSEDGKQSMQDQVDALYSVFVNEVAAQRGITPEKCLEDMADGRVFIGQNAVKAGLVDGVSTLDQLVADLASGKRGQKPKGGAGVAPSTQISQKETDMEITKDVIAKDHPAIAEAFRQEGFAAGETAERERIQGVEGAGMAGHEKLIGQLKFDGKTSPGDAALAVNAAEKKKQETAATALQGEAPAPVPAAAAPSGEGGKVDARKLADRITEHRNKAAAAGRDISFTQAKNELVGATEKED